MELLLGKYLIAKKTCALPGIGNLSIIDHPAQMQFSDKKILAPSQKIELGRIEEHTNDLIAYVARQFKCNEHEAKERIYQYTDRIKFLPAHGTMQFAGLGSFYRNAQGILHFKDAGFQQEYFKEVAAEKIIRQNEEHPMLVGDTETSTVHMNRLLSEDNTQKKSTWKVLAWLIFLISLGLIVWHYFGWQITSLFGNHNGF